MNDDLKHIIMLVLGLVGIFVIGVFFFTISSNKSRKSSVQQSKISPSVTDENVQAGTTGTFSLSTPVSSEVSVGKPFTVEVTADTEGRDLTGYDIVLKVDIDTFEVGDIQSAIDDYQAIKNEGAGFVKITGIKKTGSKKKLVPDGNIILKLTLFPKNRGTYEIAILKKEGKNVTKYFDGQTNAYYPRLNSLRIVVK